MTLDDFLERLEGVKRGGSGYVALCPAHDDRSESLSIGESEEGILIHCHAGCTTESVVQALDLTVRDLFFYTKARTSEEPEAIYSYTDENGIELFQAIRYPGKSFRQRHQNEDGEWVWNLEDVRRVPYRLPEVIAAVANKETVFVCEGEKDVEAIRGTGHVATCNPMGAGKWRDEFNEFFHGAYVVIVQDRDDAGRAHARRVKDALDPVAEQVWIVQAKAGKDAADHIEHGYAPGEFVPDRPRVERGVYTTQALYERALERLSLSEDDLPAYNPLGDLSKHLTFRPGRLYLCGGYTGDGKTALALQMTRRLCEGGARVGYFSLEMTNDDLMDRLLEHTGLPLKVLERPWDIPGSMYEVPYRDAVEEIRTWGLEIMFQPGTNSDYIVKQTTVGEYDFVIIDHVHRFSWGSERRKLEEELGKLTNLALDFNIPVLILAQLRRFQRGPNMEAYPKPILQDFRETEAFGNEAARAMAVWRQREPGGTKYVGDGSSVLVTLKDRHGPLSEAVVWFDGARQLFIPRPLGQPDPVHSDDQPAPHPVWNA